MNNSGPSSATTPTSSLRWVSTTSHKNNNNIDNIDINNITDPSILLEDPANGLGTASPASDSDSAPLTFPTFHPQPYKNDKFLSLQSRNVENFAKARRELLERQEKLIAAREEQLRHFYAEHQHGNNSTSGDEKGGSRSRSAPAPPPLTLHLAQEVEWLERKLLQLEGSQGFTLPDELVYKHFDVLIRVGAYAAALRWMEERIILEHRGPPFPPSVKSGLQRILEDGIRPMLPSPAASLRVPVAAEIRRVSSLSVSLSRRPRPSDRAVLKALGMTALLNRTAVSAMPLEGSEAYYAQLRDIVTYFETRSGELESEEGRRGRMSPLSRAADTEGGEGEGVPHSEESHALQHSALRQEVREDLSKAAQTLQPPNPFGFCSSSRLQSRGAHADGSSDDPQQQREPRGETSQEEGGERVDVDQLLRVQELGAFYLQNGDGGSGAVSSIPDAETITGSACARLLMEGVAPSPAPSLNLSFAAGSGTTESLSSVARLVPPPMHNGYTHHVLTAYLLPFLHVCEAAGLLFDDVTPMRREDQDQDHEEEEEEEEKVNKEKYGNVSRSEADGGSKAVPPNLDVLRAYIPSASADTGFSREQTAAVKRVLELFPASAAVRPDRKSTKEDQSHEAEEPSPELRTLKEVLDLYALLVQSVCETKEPALVMLLHVSLLSGFFHLGKNEKDPSLSPVPRVSEEAWLQQLLKKDKAEASPDDESISNNSSEIQAGRMLIHAFLQEHLLLLHMTRQSIQAEKVLLWRSGEMLQAWGALHHLASSSAPSGQEGSHRDYNPLVLCRAFQCLHYEWARTEIGYPAQSPHPSVMEGSADGEHEKEQEASTGASTPVVLGSPAVSCSALPLFARASPYYPFLQPSSASTDGERTLPGSCATPHQVHRVWHKLWDELDLCTREILSSTIVMMRDTGLPGKGGNDGVAEAPETAEGGEDKPDTALCSSYLSQHPLDPSLATASREQWCRVAWLVGFTVPSALSVQRGWSALPAEGRHGPPALWAPVYEALDTATHTPEWMWDEATTTLFLDNVQWHQRLQQMLLTQSADPHPNKEEQEKAVVKDVPFSSSSAGNVTGGSMVERVAEVIHATLHHASPGGPSRSEPHGRVFVLRWEALVERLLLATSVDLHRVLLDLPHFPAFFSVREEEQAGEKGGLGPDLGNSEDAFDNTASSPDARAEQDAGESQAPASDDGEDAFMEMEGEEIHDDDEIHVGGDGSVQRAEEDNGEVEPEASRSPGDLDIESSPVSGNTASEGHATLEDTAVSAALNYLLRLQPPSPRSTESGSPTANSSWGVQDICRAIVLAADRLVDALVETGSEEETVGRASSKTAVNVSLWSKEVSPAALASLAVLLEASRWSSTHTTMPRGCPTARDVVRRLLEVLMATGEVSPEHSGSEADYRNGNAMAILCLVGARCGLWRETEHVLRHHLLPHYPSDNSETFDHSGVASTLPPSSSPSSLGGEKGGTRISQSPVGEKQSLPLPSFSICSAVQFDPALLAAIYVEARNAGVPSICLLLRSHREDLFFS